MQEQRWLFVVNPKAGPERSLDVTELVKDNYEGRPVDILTWKLPNEFRRISEAIASGSYTHVVAAGGDGTVNRVAAEVVDKNLIMGILPLGSGNGLARSLAMSMDPAQALRQLLAQRVESIDTATVNGRIFLCTSGTGFDAHVGGLFAKSTRRGLRTYITLVLRELLRYEPKRYTIFVDDRKIIERAFLVTIANAGQYGNDVYIAPEAGLQDGLLHVVILKPFHLIQGLFVLRKILQRKAHLSESISTYTARNVTVIAEDRQLIHFDGEPVMEDARLEFVLRPRSLKVIAGPGFKAS